MKKYLLLFLLLAAVLAGCAQSSTAPVDPESMPVFQDFRDCIHPEMTGGELLSAFASMCETEVDCLSEMVLVEYAPGMNGDTLQVHLARQLEYAGKSEYLQLHLDMVFPMSPELQGQHGCAWYPADSVALEPLTALIGNLTPTEIYTSIGWTW